jgi:hypothetical protein
VLWRSVDCWTRQRSPVRAFSTVARRYKISPSVLSAWRKADCRRRAASAPHMNGSGPAGGKAPGTRPLLHAGSASRSTSSKCVRECQRGESPASREGLGSARTHLLGRGLTTQNDTVASRVQHRSEAVHESCSSSCASGLLWVHKSARAGGGCERQRWCRELGNRAKILTFFDRAGFGTTPAKGFGTRSFTKVLRGK